MSAVKVPLQSRKKCNLLRAVRHSFLVSQLLLFTTLRTLTIRRRHKVDVGVQLQQQSVLQHPHYHAHQLRVLLRAVQRTHLHQNYKLWG